jgi:hypothetical protein
MRQTTNKNPTESNIFGVWIKLLQNDTSKKLKAH